MEEKAEAERGNLREVLQLMAQRWDSNGCLSDSKVHALPSRSPGSKDGETLHAMYYNFLPR